MAIINGERSSFKPIENYAIDRFEEKVDVSSNNINIVNRWRELKAKGDSRTISEDNEFETLTAQISQYMTTSEDWNRLYDAIYNVETLVKEKMGDFDNLGEITNTLSTIQSETLPSKSDVGHTHTLDNVSETTAKKIMTYAERTKLSGIAENANNYTHPATHPVSMIVGLDNALNGKSDVGHTHTDYASKTGKSMAGQSVQPTKGTTVVAGVGAEIFNDYRERTFQTNDTSGNTVGENQGNVASGQYSHAEGETTTANGRGSHSEGCGTTASGQYSHAEGETTTANGRGSHSEGCGTTASGQYSHAEGWATRANGGDSHAEGFGTTANGYCSHAEGYETHADGDYSHSEGRSTTASGDYSHAEGWATRASGNCSHAEGSLTTASGDYSHTEGKSTRHHPSNINSNTQNLDIINSWYSTKFSLAKGKASHTEGEDCLSLGDYSHAGGYHTIASGNCSHAEGSGTEASNNCSHAEGDMTTANSYCSHAEGKSTRASGQYSHAEGCGTIASGNCSHAGGYGTEARGLQCVFGQWNSVHSGCELNALTAGSSLFMIGNGTSNSTRSNAFRVNVIGGCYGLSAFNSSGADYAEYFEYQDGNQNNEDRRGLFVTLDGDKIRIANADDDYILGVVSGNPSVVGDVQSEVWQGMYVKDVFGTKILEEYTVDETTDEITGETIPSHTATRFKINPNYNPDTDYVSREDRKEWDCVGMLGKIIVIDDGTCEVNSYCKVADGGIATASTKGENTYRVMKRIDDTHIQILFR